jgi:hypothetical protein
MRFTRPYFGRSLARTHPSRLIAATEQGVLPDIAVTTRVSGQPAIRDSGLKLAAIHAVLAQRLRDRTTITQQPIRMKIQRQRALPGDLAEQLPAFDARPREGSLDAPQPLLTIYASASTHGR